MPRVPADDRRRQLIAAAFRVIGQDGFAAATTRRICAEAAAPLAAFHYCFSSKRELLDALATQAMEEIADAQRAAPLAGQPAGAALRASLRSYWSTVEADPGRELVLYQLTQHVLRHPEMAAIAERQYTSYRDTAVAMLSEVAAVAGVRWSRPLGQLARMVVVVTDGVTLAWLVDRDSDAALHALDAFADQLAVHAVPTDQRELSA
ncbi:MAG: TetR/AcrR family transcriptional regulator [Sciscionella sp.]